MAWISRRQIEIERWIPSFGLPLNKEHFRERPPRTRHAIFDIGAQYGIVHSDERNPHAGLADLVQHLWDWSPVGTMLIGYGLWKLLR